MFKVLSGIRTARGRGAPALPASAPGPRRSRSRGATSPKHQGGGGPASPAPPPAGRPVLRHELPSACSPETWNPEGGPSSSEDHTPPVKKDPLLPPGKRNLCSVHSWCGLPLASPGPVGPTRGGRSISSSSLRGCLSPLLTRRPRHALPQGCAAGPEDPRHSGRAWLSSGHPSESLVGTRASACSQLQIHGVQDVAWTCSLEAERGRCFRS